MEYLELSTKICFCSKAAEDRMYFSTTGKVSIQIRQKTPTEKRRFCFCLIVVDLKKMPTRSIMLSETTIFTNRTYIVLYNSLLYLRHLTVCSQARNTVCSYIICEDVSALFLTCKGTLYKKCTCKRGRTN